MLFCLRTDKPKDLFLTFDILASFPNDGLKCAGVHLDLFFFVFTTITEQFQWHRGPGDLMPCSSTWEGFTKYGIISTKRWWHIAHLRKEMRNVRNERFPEQSDIST